MTQQVQVTSPAAFGLTSFADLLPSRDPLLGEAPADHDGFRAALFAALAPATPYEAVVAESLVAIEWELLQRRRVRDAGLRQILRDYIVEATVKRNEERHEAELDADWDAWIAAGKKEEDWTAPSKFDKDTARQAGRELAARAVSRDAAERAAALAEITEMGLEPDMLLGEAYRAAGGTSVHERKIEEFERRRREVKRDYDALQKVRPIEAEVLEG